MDWLNNQTAKKTLRNYFWRFERNSFLTWNVHCGLKKRLVIILLRRVYEFASEDTRNDWLVLDILIMLLIQRMLHLLVRRGAVHSVRVDGQHGGSIVVVVAVVMVMTGRLGRSGGRQTERVVANGERRVIGDLIERRADLHTYAVVVVLGVAARAQTSRAQAEKHGANELAERGRIHRLDLLLGAVMQVVVV